MSAEPLTISLRSGSVSGLWQAPTRPTAALVLAHGAGAGMNHKTMAAIADGLAGSGIATLRYQFPYMEKGSGRPDPPAVAHAAVRAAVAKAGILARDLPIFAGGKSFGGRMTSQAQAAEPMPGVRGLVFFGFPLHPAGKPGTDRADHLADIIVPMLFVSGSKDTLAELSLLEPMVAGLKPRATLQLIPQADHSFHVPAKTGRKDPEVLAELLRHAAAWMRDQAQS